MWRQYLARTAENIETVKVVTSQEMREIDRITIEDYGIPSLVLMERAGLAVASKVKELYPGKKVIVLCGGGNNGGDGIVAARDLYSRGFNVHVLICAKKNELSPDCNKQYQIAKKIGMPIEFRSAVNAKDVHSAVIIDAVFGTGLSRPVKGNLAGIFEFINNSEAPVISVDMPSGVSSDTGEILGEAVKANYTVTFGLPKRGHYLYPGAEYTGRLFIEDIGFPERLLASGSIKANLTCKEHIAGSILPRPKYSHKGDYGHVFIIAGSKGKTGAALMAAKACLRSGAGLVTLGVPELLMDVFQGRVTEEMTLPLADDGSGMLSSKAIDQILTFAAQKADVIAIGPGIGVSNNTEKIMNELIQKSTVPMVIDADGINSIAPPHPPLVKGGQRGVMSKGAIGLLRKAKSPIVITPHAGEMARLLKQKSEEGTVPDLRTERSGVVESGLSPAQQKQIERDRINTAISFSEKTRTYLVLKGVPTIVAGPDGNAFINTTGNPGMATAGSGDVLTGVIASLLGQGLNPTYASMSGVYLHGLAGDLAAERMGEYSMLASDIINFLPEAFMQTIDSSLIS
ncbi:MAG: NAD(P)H-hydrate dehydratase [Nitrospirae bacterium]|nr:NAD(P)H-hydrate dehydratase [Nitrospirota bacterium]